MAKRFNASELLQLNHAIWLFSQKEAERPGK
jgi:hypothetical protein